MESVLYSNQPNRQLSNLLAEHWDRFFRFSLNLCQGNRDDAEDLLSDSLLDLHKAFAGYRGQHFSSWVYQIIRNNRIDMARRQKVRPSESLDALIDATGERDIVDPGASVEHQVINAVVCEALQKSLRELPETFRVPLSLCDIEGRSYEEIAEQLHIPVGTVRSRIHRARHALRERTKGMALA